MDKVKIVSKVNHRVTVDVPEIRFSRTWLSEGSVVMVEKSTLEELMYDVGFQNMIAMGILYIEDLEVKKELGIEPPGATEPVNIIVLTDKERHMYLTSLSLVGFKDKVKKLSRTQQEELCAYAIEHKLLDVEKAKVLKEACGRDIINAVRLNELDKEGS